MGGREEVLDALVVAGDQRLVGVVLDQRGLAGRRALVLLEGLDRGLVGVVDPGQRVGRRRRLGRLGRRRSAVGGTGRRRRTGTRSRGRAGRTRPGGRLLPSFGVPVSSGATRGARDARRAAGGRRSGRAGWAWASAAAALVDRAARDQPEPQLRLPLDGLDQVAPAGAGDLDDDELVALGGDLGLGDAGAVDPLVDDRGRLGEVVLAGRALGDQGDPGAALEVEPEGGCPGAGEGHQPEGDRQADEEPEQGAPGAPGVTRHRSLARGGLGGRWARRGWTTLATAPRGHLDGDPLGDPQVDPVVDDLARSTP